MCELIIEVADLLHCFVAIFTVSCVKYYIKDIS